MQQRHIWGRIIKLNYKIIATRQIQFCSTIWFCYFSCCAMLNNTSFVFLLLTHDATRVTVGNLVLSSCVVLGNIVSHMVNNMTRWQHIIHVNLSIFAKHTVSIFHFASLKSLPFLQWDQWLEGSSSNLHNSKQTEDNWHSCVTAANL